MRQLQGAESEVKALRSMTQRMILTQKEMVRSIIDSSGSLIIALKLLIVYLHFRKRLFLRGVGLLDTGA